MNDGLMTSNGLPSRQNNKDYYNEKDCYLNLINLFIHVMSMELVIEQKHLSRTTSLTNYAIV